MGLHEDAMSLRFKMLQTAPEYLKRELGAAQWEIAILSSKAYWEANTDSGMRFTPHDADNFYKMYQEGRSLLYMAASEMCGMGTVIQALRSKGVFVVDDPFFSIGWLHEKFPDGEVPAPMLLVYPNLSQQVKLPPNPRAISYKPDSSEIETLQFLSKGYSESEVAAAANRPLSMIEFILNKLAESSLEEAEPESYFVSEKACREVISLYKDNRSPLYISVLLNIPLDAVESCIIGERLPYFKGYVTYNIYCFMKWVYSDLVGAESIYQLAGLSNPLLSNFVRNITPNPEPAELPIPRDDYPSEEEIACIKGLMSVHDVCRDFTDYALMARITGRTLQSAKRIVDALYKQKFQPY